MLLGTSGHLRVSRRAPSSPVVARLVEIPGGARGQRAMIREIHARMDADGPTAVKLANLSLLERQLF